ncbi:FAD-dependent oxidoreductase [Kocuria rosea]|uniref:FAD-dependent oxidoreductase n=1 Tax=Kocuria rosea TaxID=1275 RepID=UPI000E00FFDD|nr:FAD-dependent oxidoreductase [Kocuria rosea]STX33344.1 FAD-dependent oxidoreductase [Kocuria rosea]
MPDTTTHTPDTAALPVVVIGAGPVGLAAAAHLLERGLTPLVLEAGGTIGAAIRDWGHTRLFSPWRYNIDTAAARLLETQGWTAPDPEDLPTGAELVERYLQPLAGLLAGRIRTGARAVAVSRTGMDKTRTGNRETTPFLVRVQHPGGALEDIRASAVIDASGTWATPNPLGQAGLPAPGEAEAVTAGRITAPLPDVTGRDRDRFTGRHVLVVGAGHSAANTLLELGSLAETEPGTRISWAVRSADVSRVYGGEDRDELAARGTLGTRLRRLVESGVIEVHTSFTITGFSTTADGLAVSATTPTGEEELSVDLLVPATGFRPNLGMLAELRLDLDPAVDAPRQLGPLIDPEFHSCGSVTPHGEKMLAHPEAGFYIVGMKSYGRAPTFLMATGYEQVRSIAAALAGDRAAADDVQLVLPETGVCSTDLGGSCDLPAPRSADNSTEELGCCAPAVAQEPADACCSGPQPVTIGAAPVSVRSSCC